LYCIVLHKLWRAAKTAGFATFISLISFFKQKDYNFYLPIFAHQNRKQQHPLVDS